LLQSIDGDDAEDRLGVSLSLSADGKTLAVGAPQVDAGAGYVKVYSWDDASSNFVQREDRINGDDELGLFGHAVKLSGDGAIMAVGAPRNDANGEGSGQVKVYVLDDATLSYKELQALYGKSKGHALGFSLSVSSDGKLLAVAAPGYWENSGLVTVYEWDEDASSKTYRELQTIYGNTNDGFGRYSISFSADGMTLAVGSAWGNEKLRGTGHVKVFVLDGASSEYEQIGDTFYGEGIDQLGSSVSLSESGKILAIGATQRFDDEKSGAVKVFTVEYE
jgi:WD40 repeat protein